MRHIRHFCIALWFIASGCIGAPEPCLADTTVALHGDREIGSATVRLSDLFSGVPAVIDRDIAQAPLPGKTAVYDAPLLEKLAEKYRLDWQAASAADHVAITSSATRITADELRAAVIRKIADSGARGDIEASFDARDLEIDLPYGQSHDFIISNFDYDQVSKRFRCDVAAGHGAAAVMLPVAGRAAINRHVPVLAHRLENGAVIALTDIDWETVADDRLGTNAVTSADQLIGREVRHAINDGEVIRTNDIMPARLVTRGALVTLRIETPYMQLTAQGRALQDGAEGDVVRVDNTQSNRMVEGTVTGPGEVTVRVGQKIAASY